MNVSPKVSIIVPIYNTEPYLRECLDSIIEQTLSDIEIIVINDGSPDKSIDIIREYEKKDSRIVVIDKKNEGVGKARNDGLQRATGEFVAFMDSDDFYPSNRVLGLLYTAVVENGICVAGGRLQRLTEDGTLTEIPAKTEEYGLNFDKCTNDYYKYQYDYGYTTFIYNRHLIVDNGILFPSYGRFQDPPFFVKAMTKAKQFYYLDEPVYVYRAVSTPVKYSVPKTLDMMKGLADNLTFSRENGLSKLHCLTAQRLNHEASYMITKNLHDDHYTELISAYLKALALIDFEWLKSEGYPLPEPFVPRLFTYMRDASMKYEKLRNNKLLRLMSKLKK